MLPLLLLALADAPLGNGLRLVLQPEPDLPVTVVALGVLAGVHDEPEGRNGLAHLAEHLACFGGSKAYKPGERFARLSDGGPTGVPFRDANAETMWRLTYFYAVRPPGGEGGPLEAFADLLGGVTVTAEQLDVERVRVLAEVASADAAMAANPAVAKQLRDLYRRPKAGTAAEVKALTVADVQGFLAAHYRPNRAVLLVRGRFEPDAVRKRVGELFGKLPGGEPVGDLAAVRVAAAAWQAAQPREPRVYVEVAAAGAVRAVGAVPPPPLTEATLAAARQAAAGPGRQARQMLDAAMRWPVPKEPAKAAAVVGQQAINRLLFEAEGGPAALDRLAAVTPAEVAAVRLR